MSPRDFGLGFGIGALVFVSAAAASGAADGDAGDGGEVGRGTLGQRRVPHLHQEVALVDDAGAWNRSNFLLYDTN